MNAGSLETLKKRPGFIYQKQEEKMAIAPNTLRVGKKYRLTNFGHVVEFEVVEALENDNFIIRDVNLLENMEFHDLIRYGKGKDYELEEAG